MGATRTAQRVYSRASRRLSPDPARRQPPQSSGDARQPGPSPTRAALGASPPVCSRRKALPANDNRLDLQARPTTYKGIRMRSRLEALWAAEFDSGHREWSYEPRCFADETRQYLPDFSTGTGFFPEFWEVKGWVDDPLPIMERMEVILLSEPYASLNLCEGPPDAVRRHWAGWRQGISPNQDSRGLPTLGDWFVWIDFDDSYPAEVRRAIRIAHQPPLQIELLEPLWVLEDGF